MKGRALLVVPLGSGTWLPSPFFFLFFPSSDSSLLMGTGGGGGFVDPKWALFCFLFFFCPRFLKSVLVLERDIKRKHDTFTKRSMQT